MHTQMHLRLHIRLKKFCVVEYPDDDDMNQVYDIKIQLHGEREIVYWISRSERFDVRSSAETVESCKYMHYCFVSNIHHPLRSKFVFLEVYRCHLV